MKAALRSSVRPFAFLLALALAAPLAAQTPRPQFKAIWEPVNYPADYRLNSVFFVSPEVGWVAGAARGGKGAVVLHTRNGGEKWEIQLGDPNSAETQFTDMVFLDALHGWVFQYGSKLMRTTDGGKTWAEAGPAPGNWPNAIVFTSPQRGYFVDGAGGDAYRIHSTDNGGRSWKHDATCVAEVQIEGLTRRLGCALFDLQFVNANVGYAAGGAYNGGFSVLLKTEDGGKTWRTVFASSDIDSIRSLAFTDEKRGVVATRDYKLFRTEDGGQSWKGLHGTARGPVRFADPTVGWSCWARGCSVSADGGNTWTSRDMRLPAAVKAFSAPRRDRVFLIGDHGMVYRYRIVPVDHVAKGIHAAPPVPGYANELRRPLAAMQVKVRELQAQAAGGGDAVLKDEKFAEAVAALETEAGALAQQTPGFAHRYRNLSVFYIGMNMGEELQGRAAGIQESVAALKQASELKSAGTALAELAAKLDGTSHVLASSFVELAASPAPPAAGAVRNMAAGAGAAAPASPPGEKPQQEAPQSGGSAADAAAEEVKNVLKRFIRF